MLELTTHTTVLWAIFIYALVSFVGVVFISAPYGRHMRDGWGPRLPSRLGWVLMEAPAVLAFLFFYLQGEHRAEVVPLLLLVVWQTHYVYRAFIFPFRLRISGKRMPILLPLLAIAFNLMNAYVNATWIAHFGGYTTDWLTDPRFIVGIAVFAYGYYVNHQSDRILLNLRKPGETGYKIPRGGLYKYVSAPNYLGELLEWAGWAIATWSVAGLAFLVYTAANLGPRAMTNHRWYLERFEDYPKERKALIPFVL